MIDFLFFFHQLPQNIVGYLLTRKAVPAEINGIRVYFKDRFFRSGISLGKYIILDSIYKNNQELNNAVKHEHGHQYQSLFFGWLYLILVGLPSLVRNIWDRTAHKKWTYYSRYFWYYGGYPEKWADKLGGVVRNKVI